MKSLLFTVIFILNSISCSAKIVDYIVAVVNDEPILYSELIEHAKLSGISDIRQARDSLIEKKILITTAKSEGITVSPEEVDAALKDFIKTNNFKTIDEFKRKLETDGLTIEDAKRKLREQLLISRLIFKEVKSKIKISDVEVKNYCEKNIAKPKREVYYIFVKNEDKFKKIMNLAKTNSDFEELARKYSEDHITGQHGGYIGTVTRGTLIKSIDEAVWKAEPGSVTSAKTKNGYYIIYIKKEFIEGCDFKKIREKLYMEKFKKRLTQYMDELKKKSSVKVYLQ